jgi:hypothetical protein
VSDEKCDGKSEWEKVVRLQGKNLKEKLEKFTKGKFEK